MMLRKTILAILVAVPTFSTAWADLTPEECQATADNFESLSSNVSDLMAESYGYAVFPTIGKGGIGIGGAGGSGCVYAEGTQTGTASMAQVTIGLQFGGQAYSQIILFENKESYDSFTSGEFEFGAQASAVALTAAAQAETGTTGSSASAGVSDEDSKGKSGAYTSGMAVFTVAKGGLMYQASIGGQKFKYTAL